MKREVGTNIFIRHFHHLDRLIETGPTNQGKHRSVDINIPPVITRARGINSPNKRAARAITRPLLPVSRGNCNGTAAIGYRVAPGHRSPVTGHYLVRTGGL